jgi:hypothetical protein
MHFALDRASFPSLPGPTETPDLWPAVTIDASAQGNFADLENVKRNGIFGTEPDFLIEFRTKLRQRRWIDSDTVCFF